MRAVVFERFGGPFAVRNVQDPSPKPGGAVIRIKANGICRSDWHGWMGHDPAVRLPHVPGHEFAGVIEAVGAEVKAWKPGDRVVAPFCCGCGTCPQCRAGHTHICDDDFQPGFNAWGAFAEYVAVEHADVNLVRLPGGIDFVAAASLGCRFMTAFHALLGQGGLRGGEWLAVHGAGGVGLACTMIGAAVGARVVAIDIDGEALGLVRQVGAAATIDATSVDDVPAAVHAATGGGAHVSVDALGHPATAYNSVACLRKRGRHVQIGLALGDHRDMSLPMSLVIGRELALYGSHGMPAHRYPTLLGMVTSGRLDPARLVTATVSLDEAGAVLAGMTDFSTRGVVVIDRFRRGS